LGAQLSADYNAIDQLRKVGSPRESRGGGAEAESAAGVTRRPGQI
jgi:hypothetical protein